MKKIIVSKKLISAAPAVALLLSSMTALSASAQTLSSDRVTAKKINAEDIKEGDRLFICFEEDSVVVSDIFSAKRVSPVAVDIREENGEKVIVNAPVHAAAFTVSYSEGGKTLRLAVNEYIATSNRTSGSASNPLVGWNNTDKLLDHNAVDVESALTVLKEESALNNDATHIQRWLASLPCNQNIGKPMSVSAE